MPRSLIHVEILDHQAECAAFSHVLMLRHQAEDVAFVAALEEEARAAAADATRLDRCQTPFFVDP